MTLKVTVFKGTVSRDLYIFFKGLLILISTFSECSDGFLGLSHSKAFHYPIQLLTFLHICRPLIGCMENTQEFTCQASGMIFQNNR